MGLAANVPDAELPSDALPSALHRYLAEELFNRAPDALQDALLELALLGDASDQALRIRFGARTESLISEATELGFGSGEHAFELHPLLREFLLEKLIDDPSAETRVRQALAASLSEGSWDHALQLITRFKLYSEVETALKLAFKPLTRSGRFGTLARFVEAAGRTPAFPPPSVEVAQAEIAFRDGNFELAIDLALRLEPKLGDHPLASRTAAIVGQASHLLADFATAEAAFERALRRARRPRPRRGVARSCSHKRLRGEAWRSAFRSRTRCASWKLSDRPRSICHSGRLVSKTQRARERSKPTRRPRRGTPSDGARR